MFTKACIAICTLLACISGLRADTEDMTSTYKNEDTGVQVDTDLIQGYRLDRLKWSISGVHHKPDILSELTYKNVQIYQTRLRTQITKNDYFTKLMLGYGFVCCGKNQDSDYAGNNRHREFSRSHHSVTGDFTLDAQIAFGKNFQVSPTVTVSPLAGYNWSRQKFRTKRGHDNSGLHTSYRKLNSTYQATWDAPFIGARVALKAMDDLNLFAEYDFLFANQYRGQGHWNLRKLHFTQRSSRIHGFGHMGTIGASYKLSSNCSLAAEYQLSYLHAKGGIDKSREGHYRSSRPFHKASLLSSEVRLAFNYAF